MWEMSLIIAQLGSQQQGLTVSPSTAVLSHAHVQEEALRYSGVQIILALEVLPILILKVSKYHS